MTRLEHKRLETAKELLAFVREGNQFSAERRIKLAQRFLDLLAPERKPMGTAPSPTPTRPQLIVMRKTESAA